MNLTIRPATPDDLPALATLQNEIDPENKLSPATLKARDRRRRPDLIFSRLIVERGGEVVGSGSYGQLEWFENPRSLMLGVNVRPGVQGQGIGRALYERLLSDLAQHQPERLLAVTAEDRPRALRFLKERGWQVVTRERPCAVKLAEADPGGLDEAVAKLHAQGYEIRTFAELADDPKREAKYYTLVLDADRDVPPPEGETVARPSFERYWQLMHAHEHFDPTLWFVAVQDGEYAALSQLFRSDMPGTLYTGFTGTARAHRRRGLALALKLTALSRARALGASEVHTENDARNAPMIAINDALGFRERPARLTYALKFESEV